MSVFKSFITLQIKALTIEDKTLISNNYHEVAIIASASKCEIMCFRRCELSAEKLSVFGRKCEEEHIKVSMRSKTNSFISFTDVALLNEYVYSTREC